MKTLIAPTDFSKTSLNAVNYAADMAVAINARLLLLHVMHIEIVADIPEYTIQLEDDIYEQRNHKLQLLKQKLEKRTANRVPVVCNLMEGSTNSTIKEVAENKQPFAIVLGSKGVSNLQHIVFGSTALYTAKHTQFPVLLIPEKAKFTSVSAIAYASDLILENATSVIKTLRQWLNVFHARLDIINVNDNENNKEEREKEFSFLKKRLSNHDVYFDYTVNDSVPVGILQYAKKNKPDMLVLMYHKESLLHRLVYRSEFNHIFNNTSIPLLIIPG